MLSYLSNVFSATNLVQKWAFGQGRTEEALLDGILLDREHSAQDLLLIHTCSTPASDGWSYTLLLLVVPVFCPPLGNRQPKLLLLLMTPAHRAPVDDEQL